MRSPVYFAAAAAGSFLLGASAASAGCSSSEGGDGEVGDVGDAGDAGNAARAYPAFRPPVPQVINGGRGPVLKDFTVVPVFFAGDGATASLPDFATKYAASSTWTSAVAQYGAGAMKIAPAIVLNETPPVAIGETEIEAWLRGKLDGTHSEWGKNDRATLAKTVFAVIYPSGTTVTRAIGDSSCNEFYGFHSSALTKLDEVQDGGEAGALDAEAGVPERTRMGPDTAFLYLVAARCTYEGLTQAETLTALFAHELLETATDPYGAENSVGGVAYNFTEIEHAVWGAAMGGAEIADLCNIGGYAWAPPSIGYTVARSWSNASASLYHNPCVPIPPGEPYFNTFIKAPDSFPLYGNPAEPPTKGVSLRVGETKTFDVMLFSDVPTSGPWNVYALESPAAKGNAKVLTLGLDTPSGVNGDVVHLTVYASGTTATKTSAVTILSTLGVNQAVWHTAVSLTPEH